MLAAGESGIGTSGREDGDCELFWQALRKRAALTLSTTENWEGCSCIYPSTAIAKGCRIARRRKSVEPSSTNRKSGRQMCHASGKVRNFFYSAGQAWLSQARGIRGPEKRKGGHHYIGQ